ncbi:siderophore-interacting protein [Catenulispora pinisilvae]|uniref:siderophore-interacting protein n=1 Tax=Catenulispora pinisilvae TaxID=2705253 RepID=UPI002B2649BD|nr:siderophore-interacting protein [Catenulispora pinisilvae]
MTSSSVTAVLAASAAAAAISSLDADGALPPAATAGTASRLVHGKFRFFHARVVGTRRLGPSIVRVTFGGEQLRDFAGGGRDQSFSLFLPRAGQQVPVVPTDAGDDWFGQWRAMGEDQRAVMRSYTIRSHDREHHEVDVDFVLHGTASGASGSTGSAGPASRWAAEAVPGDRVVLLGPADQDNRSIGFQPPADTDWVLIAADETALPAAAAILEWLPEEMRARAWIEVPDLRDTQELLSAAEADITWLVRDPAQRPGALLADEIRDANFPDGAPYAWLAGEAAMIKTLRRHLVGERGFDRRRVEFSGYWRLGATEEDLRTEKIAAAAAAAATAGPADAALPDAEPTAATATAGPADAELPDAATATAEPARAKPATADQQPGDAQ